MFELVFSQDVQNALDNNQPIMALESTIISHGMPYPQNIQMVQNVEKIAREYGVTPATLAVMDGKAMIGIEPQTIEKFAKTQNIRKLSRADIADCIAQGETGATTVAATMILAQLAKIEVFATGGIGGVHQGVGQSYDISADLGELSQSDVIVVCAGAKAILDLPKTYEVLESLGVPVYSYQSDEIPAFYSRQSGIKSPMRADNPTQIAKSFVTQKAMGLKGGMLINNPIPKSDEIPQCDIEPIIEKALGEAYTQNIKDKSVTPFLLKRIYELTNGRSLEANIALVQNNVRLGAQIALALHEMKNK